MKKLAMAAAVFIAAALGQAQAYTSYLKPSAFWPGDGQITIEGAFATHFFTPQVALRPQFTVLDPNGAHLPFERIAVLQGKTTLDANLPLMGTYRFSTGEQLGQVSTLVAEDGQWRAMRAGEILPEGTETTTLQTVTLADAYVSRGRPTRETVDHMIGTLAIHPITHPNQVLAANGFVVEVLFNGAPLADSAVVLYGAGDPDTKTDRFFVTGADGRATLTFNAPGHYVAAARFRADAPAGSQAQVRSYTTTLTFEALTTLPPVTPEDRQDRRRRRN